MTQDQAYDIFCMGHNVFLTGAAGSGKTYLVNRMIQYCYAHGIGVAVTASTGIAATHIGGMTIHSWSGMGIRDTLSDADIEHIVSREYLAKRFARTQVLIIDEVSMLSGDFLANLDRLLRSARVSPEPFGGMQVVLVGDFFQLPPVSRDMGVQFAFEHPSWRTFRLAICVLTTQYRQVSEAGEDPLLQILSDIRSDEVSQMSISRLTSRQIPIQTDDHTELFTKNISVDAYNTKRLSALHGDTFVYEMQSKGAEGLVETLKKGCLAPETLILKEGSRVMFVKNNFEGGYANGSLGHVVGRYENLPIVELLDGTRIFVDYAEWAIEEDGRTKASITQIPLRLAWAITIHKSQGMTLDSAVMDLSDCFVAGQGYVALSRVRSLQGLILRGLNSLALQIDPRVRRYDAILRATSERATERLQGFTPAEREKKQHETIRRFGGVIEPLDLTVSKKTSKSEKIPTQDETMILVSQGLSIEEIASRRNLKSSTIVSHIEKLIESKQDIDLSKFRPADDIYDPIRRAFVTLGTTGLSPVREYLLDVEDREYDYDQIRLVRLCLPTSDRKKIEETMLYASEGIEF